MFCPSCGQLLKNSEVSPATPDLPDALREEKSIAYSMWWHKFLIYFALFAGALLNLISSLSYLTGYAYDIVELEFYSENPMLKVLDLAYGAVLVGMAFLGIYTRFRLARYKRNGPTCLTALYVFSIALPVLYPLAFSVCAPALAGVYYPNYPSLAVTVAFLIFNIIYYKKRKELFVN